jgi:hypothetical protein
MKEDDDFVSHAGRPESSPAAQKEAELRKLWPRLNYATIKQINVKLLMI